jgi:hypothetical protein
MEDDEAGWNNLVHTPLLKAVFYGTPREVASLTASEHGMYTLHSLP